MSARFSLVAHVACLVAICIVPCALAQDQAVSGPGGGPPGGGGPPTLQQMAENVGRMVADVRANPDLKPRMLAQMKMRLTARGADDIDAKLAEVGRILDKAIAMNDADFKANQDEVVGRIVEQLRGGPGPGGPAPGKVVPWIDVHVHLFARKPADIEKAVQQALVVMDQGGVEKMIVMPTPRDGVLVRDFNDDADVVAAIRKHATRFAFMAGGGALNVMIQQTARQTTVSDGVKRRFEQKAEELLKGGARGFGEMAIHHLSHDNGHPYESVPGDHPLFLLLADVAARHDVPIDIHFDVVAKDMTAPDWLTSPLNPKKFPANVAAFERLLDHNPKVKIVWQHAGSDTLGHWTAKLSRDLLEKHPNLYLAFRLPPGPGRFPENNPMLPDGQVRPDWLKLLQDFPTRFMMGSDRFIASADFEGKGFVVDVVKSSSSPASSRPTQRFFNALPEDLARKIASENAAAVYTLK